MKHRKFQEKTRTSTGAIWEAIENGDFPQWELGVQIVEEKDEHSFDFDYLIPPKSFRRDSPSATDWQDDSQPEPGQFFCGDGTSRLSHRQHRSGN